MSAYMCIYNCIIRPCIYALLTLEQGITISESIPVRGL